MLKIGSYILRNTLFGGSNTCTIRHCSNKPTKDGAPIVQNVKHEHQLENKDAGKEKVQSASATAPLAGAPLATEVASNEAAAVKEMVGKDAQAKEALPKDAQPKEVLAREVSPRELAEKEALKVSSKGGPQVTFVSNEKTQVPGSDDKK